MKNDMTIEFFKECLLPTTTAQMRRHTKSGTTYKTAAMKYAEALFLAIMRERKPERPFVGPVDLTLSLTWPHTAKSLQNGLQAVPKESKPDLENAEKMIIDAMTKAGYWKDDAQVARKTTSKFHGDIHGIFVMVKPMEMMR